MKALDWQLGKKGYIPMSGQIVDASLVPAPRQRNTDGERQAIKAGKAAKEIWPDQPDKAQKDLNARWNEEDQRMIRRIVFPTNQDRRQGAP